MSGYIIRRWNFIGLNFYPSSPVYMPPQWSACIQPEGKEYFYRDSGLSVVTEARMYDPRTANKVCAWATEVERLAKNQGLELEKNIELFLEIDGDNCSYYLVDRVTATLFWLSEYTTTELGLQPAVSDSHLSKYSTLNLRGFPDTNNHLTELLLEAQYWSHIENFCMHFGGLPQKAIDDLILVFLHASGGESTKTKWHCFSGH